MRRKPSPRSVTVASGCPSSVRAALISAAVGDSAYCASHSVPPVKSIDGRRPPSAMKTRPGMVISALNAKYQLRLPTMSYTA
jgi:hypothetical protein